MNSLSTNSTVGEWQEAQEDASSADSWLPEGSEEDPTADSSAGRASLRGESASERPAERNDDETLDAVAKADTRRVFIQKFIVVFVLVVAGVCMSALTYSIASRDEKDSFEHEYYDLAAKISDGILQEFDMQILATHTLSTSTTSEAKFHHGRWPFVFIPEFRLRTVGILRARHSTVVSFGPVVTDKTLAAWETFVIQHKELLELTPDKASGCRSQNVSCRTIEDGLYHFNKTNLNVEPGPDASLSTYFPMLHAYPNPEYIDTWAPFILCDLHTGLNAGPAFDQMMRTKGPALFEFHPNVAPAVVGRPRTGLIAPVFESFDNDNIVGWYGLDFVWQSVFHGIASPSHGSIFAVLKTSAGDVLSFEISGDDSVFLGFGDMHDRRYDDYKIIVDMCTVVELSSSDSSFPLAWNITHTGSFRGYFLYIYPTESFESVFVTNNPMIYSIVIASIFVFALVMFAIYDFFVERRQKRVLNEAMKFNSIINSLFPRNVRQRLFPRLVANSSAGQEDSLSQRRRRSFKGPSENHPSSVFVEPAKSRLRRFLRQKETTNDQCFILNRQHPYRYDDPIADLFPDCTIMFADISGFTAWSSEREPSQVFFLLETLYGEFDQLAHDLGVFKVETIGDCYVAVTGLPDPNEEHAVVMARFSHECCAKMRDLVSQLESSLGPGTSDLDLRIGLHSGPVTAGVLRGEKARFQLFGDTVNTAARMESTGERSMIQVSEQTHDLLSRVGKEHWLTPRDGVVYAKGKGDLRTWWLNLDDTPTSTEVYVSGPQKRLESHPWVEKSYRSMSYSSYDSRRSGNWGDLTLDFYGIDLDRHARLISWNAELLGDLLLKIVAGRVERHSPTCRQDISRHTSHKKCGCTTRAAAHSSTPSLLSEVTDVVVLPEYKNSPAQIRDNGSKKHMSLNHKVKDQLHHYIFRIAACYKDNPFHSFEHASHVTLSAQKLLKRIISPCESDFHSAEEEGAVARSLHESTFGISSDPLCQFSIVFSALIHDCDHQGVSNSQLVREGADVAVKYNHRSVAEQNSIDIAWNILVDDRYQDLRDCIFDSESECRRFRQLVVNSVIATDIFDKELNAHRFERWNKSFGHQRSGVLSLDAFEIHRKATVVIEHIIQASDIAHTMQHWHVYTKWMQKFFFETYDAYLAGRGGNDPSVEWYENELVFFDQYVIPLAKKLQSCGVFGVASDEYLSYALNNREEWQRKGREVVKQMLMAYGELQSSTDDKICLV